MLTAGREAKPLRSWQGEKVIVELDGILKAQALEVAGVGDDPKLFKAYRQVCAGGGGRHKPDILRPLAWVRRPLTHSAPQIQGGRVGLEDL